LARALIHLPTVHEDYQSDLGACNGVFHHLNETEMHQLREDADALLKPNGPLSLSSLPIYAISLR